MASLVIAVLPVSSRNAIHTAGMVMSTCGLRVYVQACSLGARVPGGHKLLLHCNVPCPPKHWPLRTTAP